MPPLKVSGTVVLCQYLCGEFFMSREDPKVNVRLPQVLKDRLHAVAEDNGRSVNSEIVSRLEGSFYKVSLGDIDLPDASAIKSAADQVAVDQYNSFLTNLLNVKIKSQLENSVKKGLRECYVDLQPVIDMTYGDDQLIKWRLINDIESVLKAKGYEVARQEHLDLLIKF